MAVDTHRIAVIPGDGIGREVVPEGIRVLEAAGRRFGISFEWEHFPWGCQELLETGRMLPEEGLERLVRGMIRDNRLPRRIRALADTLRRHRVILAHSHEFSMAAYGAWAARRAGVAHLFTMHGSRYYAERLRRRVALRVAAMLSGAVVSVSHILRQHLCRDLWIRASRIVTIPNGVRQLPLTDGSLREELHVGPGDQLAVAVGNLYPVKGHSYLLEALGLLAAAFPRLHVAIVMMSQTGGHGDAWVPAGFRVPRRAWLPENVADGAAEVRRLARRILMAGPDFLKLCATGGITCVTDSWEEAQFTVEELRAMVEEAHARFRSVACHAYGGEGLRRALEGGCDSIEHGQALNLGYDEAKWVGERCLLHAAERGLPVARYRPGEVGGDSRTGRTVTDHFVAAIIKGCLEFGAFPELDMELDIAPIDYVARAMIHLVFRRQPLVVAASAEFEKAGDFRTMELDGISVLIVRQRDGALRAFHNVCRHHAAEVCTGEGSISEMVCPYHGWTYRLDGKLVRAPRLGQSEVFDRDAFGLKPVAVEAWGSLVFIHLGQDPPPLAPHLTELERRLDAMKTGALTFVARRTYDMRCNWKVYVDNYLEGYHLPIVHPQLFRELDYENYRTETARFMSIQHAPLREVKGGGTFIGPS